VLNSLTKSECPICQTELSNFDSSNFAVSFIKFQNRLFNPSSRQHQRTFIVYGGCFISMANEMGRPGPLNYLISLVHCWSCPLTIKGRTSIRSGEYPELQAKKIDSLQAQESLSFSLGATSTWVNRFCAPTSCAKIPSRKDCRMPPPIPQKGGPAHPHISVSQH
jgi:hypothetical protein